MTDFNVLAISYNDPDAGKLFSKSLHETGFAILKDHPVERTAIDNMYTTWSSYFTDDARFADAVQNGEVYGYYGFKSENAKGNTQKDLKEFFHAYEDKPARRHLPHRHIFLLSDIHRN